MQSLPICMYETPERWNWRCVPSPQSKRMTSEPRLSAPSGTLRSTLGHEAPGLEAVIANHLESKTPVVLEGDFIHPALAAQTTFAGMPNGGQVRALFLYEEDEGQLVENFLQREPEQGPQATRARVSWLYG